MVEEPTFFFPSRTDATHGHIMIIIDAAIETHGDPKIYQANSFQSPVMGSFP